MILNHHLTYIFVIRCQCDSTFTCLDPNDEVVTTEIDNIQVCLTSFPSNILDINFLQITQTDPTGVQSTEVVIGVDGNEMESSLVLTPGIDGQPTVILLPSSLFEGATTIAIFGSVVTDAPSEESFQLDLELQPSQEMSPYDEFSSLNLSTTKEVGGCVCVMTSSSQEIALAPPPPNLGSCPDPLLISTRSKNEVSFCYCSRLDIVNIQYMALTHENANIEVWVIQSTIVLDPSSVFLEIKGKCAFVRVQIPSIFYDGITQITEAQALSVFTLDKMSEQQYMTVTTNLVQDEEFNRLLSKDNMRHLQTPPTSCDGVITFLDINAPSPANGIQELVLNYQISKDCGYEARLFQADCTSSIPTSVDITALSVVETPNGDNTKLTFGYELVQATIEDSSIFNDVTNHIELCIAFTIKNGNDQPMYQEKRQLFIEYAAEALAEVGT